MCCLILAFYYATGLTAAGLDLGLIVGLAAGLLSFIPYVGSVTGRGHRDRPRIGAVPGLAARGGGDRGVDRRAKYSKDM